LIKQHPESNSTQPNGFLDACKKSNDGGYTIGREYVAQSCLWEKEMFYPLTHKSGSAQVDFGEGLTIIGGEEYATTNLMSCRIASYKNLTFEEPLLHIKPYFHFYCFRAS
jgi:hypothetical protein